MLANTIDPRPWTTAQVLQKQASARPDKTAISFIDGPSFTYAQLQHTATQIGNGLLNQGVIRNDKVATLLSNVPELCEIWLGCHQIDAVLVCLNPELMGQFLAHALNLSEASILICNKAQLDKIKAIAPQLSALKKIFVTDGCSQTGLGEMEVADYPCLKVAAPQTLSPQARFCDLAALIFTSGTTGPSKAVMMPHAHCYLYGQGTIDNLDLGENDSYYITMTLFHANGLLMQLYACLICGAKAVIRKKFSASNWLKDIREHAITHTNLLGVMSDFIESQPATDKDKQHRLRVIGAAPASGRTIHKFKTRFGVQMAELYGMSEVNIPLYTPMSAPRPGSCGKPYSDYFEVRIADPKTDLPCSTDQVGEIQVRPKVSACFMSGYYRMPEQTLEAWRNLWFHTGDAGKMDQDGYFYFVDRIKDCLRRRGENISSYEVESALLQHPDIEECAVIGVPSDIPDGEDEVMAVMVTSQPLDSREVKTFCQLHIPGYAIPRYYRFMAPENLPRTATNKIRKVELRQQGVTGDTWDSLNTDGASDHAK